MLLTATFAAGVGRQEKLIADRQCATVHRQIDGIDEIRLIAGEEYCRFGDVHRHAAPSGEILNDAIFRNVLLTDGRADSVRRN